MTAAENSWFMIWYYYLVRNNAMGQAGCSKRSRCKARENLRIEAYEQYAAGRNPLAGSQVEKCAPPQMDFFQLPVKPWR